MDCQLKFDYFMYFDFPVEICIQIANCAHSLVFQRAMRENYTKHVHFLALYIYHLYKKKKLHCGGRDLKAMNTTSASRLSKGAWEGERGKKVGPTACVFKLQLVRFFFANRETCSYNEHACTIYELYMRQNRVGLCKVGKCSREYSENT
jgi:hypothetical protein